MDRFLSAVFEDPASLETKRVEQIVKICGDGILADASACSASFREFLKNIPSSILKKYSTECLDGTAGRDQNSGLILQDIVNEVGERLGYQTEPGFYRGSSNRIGNDGLWRSKDFAFVVEVKTSDLSIKLDTIAGYRHRLIQSDKITEANSSLLIVLGRQDTGDLEAQIRGSKHAWDIRMIGIDSLFRLLEIKENLNDLRSAEQITGLLKPIEYTRVDKLIDIVFLTSADISTPEIPEILGDREQSSPPHDEHLIGKSEEIAAASRTHSSPVNFYDKCVARINHTLGKNFIKTGRVTYTSSDKSTNAVLLNSKTYIEGDTKSYWYGFRPNQSEFLATKDHSYVAFGCGSEDSIILIPYARFKSFVPQLGKTSDEDGNLTHSHVFIVEERSRYRMRVGEQYIDITEFVI